MKVAIVGGEPSLISGPWASRLEEFGLEVIQHQHEKSRGRPAAIPSKAEGVIVIRDMTKHRKSISARNTADERGLLYVAVPRKWSKAEPLLRMHGFIPTVFTSRQPAAYKKEEVALHYVCEARREGRVPKRDEVVGALSKAFGVDVPLSRKVYVRVCSQAAAQQKLILSDNAEVPESSFEAELLNWAEAVYEDTPEVSLNFDSWGEQTSSLCDTKVSKGDLRSACQHVLAKAHRRFSDDPESRTLAMRGWVARTFVQWKDHEGPFPATRMLDKHSKIIFGCAVRGDLIKDARVEVFGEWARDLVRLNAAQLYFLSKGGERGVLRELLENGSVSGLFSVRSQQERWYTSHEAIDAYLGTVVNVSDAESDPEEVVDTPAEDSKMTSLLERIQAYDSQIAMLEHRISEMESTPATPVTRTDTGFVEALKIVTEGLLSQGLEFKIVPTAKG